MSVCDIKTRSVPNWLMAIFYLIAFLTVEEKGLFVMNAIIGIFLCCTLNVLNIPTVGRFGGADIKAMGIVCGIMSLRLGMLSIGVAIVSLEAHRFITLESKIIFIPHLLIGVLVAG